MRYESAPNGVRRAREKKFWTLRKLAKKIGTTEPHLSKIERGLVEPQGVTKERIAEALGMDRDELFPEPVQPQEASA